MSPPRQSRVWQLVILLLSFLSLGFIALISFKWVSADVALILGFGDFVICCVFLVDFFVGFTRAPSKGKFMRWGWIDFVSSIPALPFLRLGRLARVFRVLRILRGIRSGVEMRRIFGEARSGSAFCLVGMISFLAVIMGAIFILEFESGGDGPRKITTGADALWWAFVTMTTVGYGDFYPVTMGGRLVAVVLMLSGIGLFGTFTGYVASWFESTESETDALGDNEVLAEIKLLRESVDKLLNEGTPTPGPTGKEEN